MKVFKDLVAVGCVAPCDLNRREAFAGENVLSPQVGVEDLAEADLSARVRFWLYSLSRFCRDALPGAFEDGQGDVGPC